MHLIARLAGWHIPALSDNNLFDLPLIYGLTYDGCCLDYRVAYGHTVELTGLTPATSSDDRPYANFPPLLPFVPLRLGDTPSVENYDAFAARFPNMPERPPAELIVAVPPPASIGVSLWGVAGILYPIGMHLGLGEVPMSVYMHFFTSLLICGLIAAAYPFLWITFVSLHNYYPAFVRLDSMSEIDRSHLERMRRFAWTYLGLAALVPMLAVAVLAIIGTEAKAALIIMAGGGISEGDVAELVQVTGVREVHVRATMIIREPPGWDSWSVVPFRKALPGDEYARLVTDPQRIAAIRTNAERPSS